MESLGARFKGERERQKMTLEDVALSTKIGTRMLQAIEADEFNRLPGGIFNKGFVRSYARHLGLDEEQAVADYLAISGGPAPEHEPEALVAALAAKAEETKEANRIHSTTTIPWSRLAILLLLIALGFVVWSSRDSRNRGRQSAPPSGPVNSTVPAAVHQSQEHPVQAASAEFATPQPGVLPASQSSTLSANGERSGSFSLRIVAREDCWLTITADGKEVMRDLLPANSDKSIGAQQLVIVKAGNVGGLDFWFNGRKLPPQGDYDQVKTLTFVPEGLQTAAARAQLPTSPDSNQP